MMKIRKTIFGELEDGKDIELFDIKHEDGSEIKITNYGATIVSLKVPDKIGYIEDVVLGFDNLENYRDIRNFYGAIVGRYGNRIAKGTFALNGVKYQLPINEGNNSLHGGENGFDRVVWEAEEIDDDKTPGIKMTYLSKDGEEGYPGNLEVTVTYTFTKGHELRIDYKVVSDKLTVKNITNHSYFNLSGNVKNNILDHELHLKAEKFLPVKEGLIPIGEYRYVKGTPMDFTKSYKIGDRINSDDMQLKIAKGYDHTWILEKEKNTLDFAGSVYEPNSGRFMEIFTTEPGVQFYSGNFLDGSHLGHNGTPYKHRDAFCLQTQHFPDSPNHPEFPNTVIGPGEVYKSSTIYRFSVKESE